MPEGRDNPVRDNGCKVGRHAREGIEADRLLDVGGIDIDEVTRPPAWDVIQRRAREVTVRVEQRDARAALEVLAQQVEQQCALARAGLADEIQMPAAFVFVERDKFARCASAKHERI
jgi:hypothetical protein